MDVQLLGFQAIAGRPGHITAVRYQEIRGWISGPSIVAEVHGAQSRAQVDEIVETYRPDYIELGLAELAYASHVTLPMILRVDSNETFDVKLQPAYVLVSSGDTRSFDSPRIIQVFSLHEAEVVLSLEDVGGIALLGSDEVSPGLKNYDTLAPILEMLETDN
jgi:phosphoribosylanthranilate isomerase